MARSTTAWLCGAVAAVGIGLAVWYGRGDAVVPIPIADAGSSLAPVVTEPARATPAAEPEASHRLAAAPTGTPSAAVQVQVVDPAGNPIPGARVAYLDSAKSQIAARALTPAERRRRAYDSRWWRQFDEVAVADHDGIARWPWRQDDRATWQVTVEHDGMYGADWLRMTAPATTIHRLALRTDRSFAVRVVDARRQPVTGVALLATHAHADGRADQVRRTLAITGPDGIATVPHVQTWHDEVLVRGQRRPVTITPSLPGIEVRCDVDLTTLPAEPVELVLPPCGAFEITVRDAFGEAVADDDVVIREDVPDAGVHTATTDAHGLARFPQVGLARSWRLGSDEPPERRRRVVGPAVADEVVQVLVQPEAVPMLRGRLLRGNTPAADAVLRVESPREWLTDAGVRTDADGEFRIAVRSELRDREITGITVRPMDADGPLGELAEWRGNLRLVAGMHDLGTLLLQPEPLLVAGQLVMATGEPPTVAVDLHVEARDPDDTWHPHRVSHRRAAAGRFSLFGAAPPAALRLTVSTRNQLLAVPPTPFVAGTRELRIELHRGGSVRASIVASSPIAAFCLQPLLVPTTSPPDLPPYARFHAQLDPRLPRESSLVADDPLEMGYTWPAVAPGRYRLEVGARGMPQPLLVVPDVVVVDGQRNADPRLQHLTVPGLQTIELSLPQAGTAAPRAGGVGVVAVLVGDVPAAQCWQVDGPVALFANTQPFDVLVRLQGFRDRIVRGITQSQVIELAPGVPVTLRVQGDDAAVAGCELQLESLDDPLAAAAPAVYSAAAGGAPPPYRLSPIGGRLDGGVLTLPLPRAGRYRLSASSLVGNVPRPLIVDPVELRIGEAGGEFDVRVATNERR